MKMYNKPVVEINGFDVEDIITASSNTAPLSTNDVTGAAYNAFVSGSATSQTNVLVYEW